MAFDPTEFSDQDLRTTLNRALRTVVVLILVGILPIWFAWGWRSMLMFLVGGAIAATGILEWRQLMGAVLVRLRAHDAKTSQELSSPPPAIRGVVFWFFIRFVAAAGLLYVSLKSLDGKVVALLIGLALALVALLLEALRLIRAWTT